MAANGNLPENVLCYGSEEPRPEQVELRAGPLTAVFEAGDLRWIRLGDREIVRRIYVALRDRNWGTVPNRISNLTIRPEPSRFEITYDVANREGDIDFLWSGRIVGEETGEITFSMHGTAQTSFWKNRIGFCVLHPIKECVGRRCRITKVDGTVEEGAFPLQIAPHQPFCDFREIAHGVEPGSSVHIRFEGDWFEMEDQRNWTDASFKTYCTPLRLPFPAEVTAGTTVAQSVTVTLHTAATHAVRAGGPTAISFSFAKEEGKPLPVIGLGINPEAPELSSRQVELLRWLNLDHLRVDLDLSGGAWRPVLERAVRESRHLSVALEAAIMLPGSATADLLRFEDDLNTLKPDVARWLVFNRAEKSTSARWVQLLRHSLAGSFPGTPFVAGTNAYFAELNRERPETSALDGICYSINPQVHAVDNDSLVENLAAQRDTVESATQFAGGLPVYVTPVTLRPRFNPNATGPEPKPAWGELPPQVDVRQMSLFGAAWTLGSLKYLCEAGVAGITYYETIGWRGVLESAEGCALPDRFRSMPGGAFPLFHIFANMGEFKGGDILRSESSAPLLVDGLVLCRGGRFCVLLANMRCEPHDVSVRADADVAQLTFLDAPHAEAGMREPESFRTQFVQDARFTDGRLELTLGPYAIARVAGVLR